MQQLQTIIIMTANIFISVRRLKYISSMIKMMSSQPHMKTVANFMPHTRLARTR